MACETHPIATNTSVFTDTTLLLRVRCSLGFRGEQLREAGCTERLQQCKTQLPESSATANNPHKQTPLSNILILTSQKP